MKQRTEEEYYKESKRLRAVLAMRKMKNGGPYKPYAIIDEYAFSATEELLQKGTPL